MEGSSKSERTRERILDAAAHVLSQKGYAGTRVGAVASVAEVHPPAIYYYFESREELIEEVMWVGAHRVRTHVEQVLANVPENTSPIQRIMHAVEAHLRYELHISDYATAAIRNAGQLPEPLRVRPEAEEALYNRIWRELLEEAKDVGELRPDIDITVTRLLIIGAMNWATEWWNPESRTLEELVQATQDLVYFGMAAKSPQRS